jgi:thymidylate kinase
MKGIVIEGASGVGKTSVVRELRLELANHTHTAEFYITEEYTYQMLTRKKNRGAISGEMVAQHLQRIIQTITMYHVMLHQSLFPIPPGKHGEAVALIERTALTHCAYMGIGPELFETHFRTLNSLNIELVVLDLSPDQHRERLKEAFSHRQGGDWSTHVESLGGPEKTIEMYLKFQEKVLLGAEFVSQWIPVHVIQAYPPAPVLAQALLRLVT